MLKILTQNIILFSAILVVLLGSNSIYKIIDSCIEKNVSIDIDIESESEDDFENEVKLKSFFENNNLQDCLSLLRIIKSTFNFQQSIIHNDLDQVFGPPPDFIN
jgi:hypothetical protein